jgi:hypothetical protein
MNREAIFRVEGTSTSGMALKGEVHLIDYYRLFE